MRAFALAAALLVASAGLAPQANTEPFTDNLSECLARSVNQQEKVALMAWLFQAIAAHPSVKPMAKVSQRDVVENTDRAAKLFERLMTRDCREETFAVVENQGMSGIQRGFRTLGQVAMQGLMNHSDVQKRMGRLQQHVDQREIERVLGGN